MTTEPEEQVFDNSINSPIYVIELDEEKIKEIRNNTNTNDYIDYEGSTNSEGYFKSDFIKNNPEIFTTVCNNARGCET